MPGKPPHPFASQAQRRLFYARPDLHQYIAERDKVTPKGIPMRKHPSRGATKHALAAQYAARHKRAASRRHGTYVGFDNLKAQLAHRQGVTDPAALAAAIGRRKYGRAGFGGLRGH